MERIWLPVKDYEGLYEVSNFGEVKSLNYKKTGKEKLLSPGKDSKGYLQVILSKNNIKNHFRINRLVWQTFVGEIPPKWDVNHLDENKENNHLENLEACSHEKNINWGTRNAKVAAALRGVYNDPQKSKAVEAIDKITGRVVYTFPSTMEAGRQGFHSGHISDCCNGERKSHKGFIWRYVS